MKSSKAAGIWGGLDPRTKLLCVLSSSAVLALTPIAYYQKFIGYSLILLFLIVISRAPITNYMKRVLFLIPMIVFMALSLLFAPDLGRHQKMMIIFGLSVKTTMTFIAAGIIVMTVEFDHIIRGLETMKFPRLMTGMLKFAYQYIFLFKREALRIAKAKKSRTCGKRKNWENWRTDISIVSVFFTRILERSYRIYVAMLSRGYRDYLPSVIVLRLSRKDYIFGIFFHVLLVSAAVLL